MSTRRERFALFVSRIPFRIPFEDELDLLLMYKSIKPQHYEVIERASVYLHKTPCLFGEFKKKYLNKPGYFFSHNKNQAIYLYQVTEYNSSFVPIGTSEL
jgi:hypothetical protein